MEQLFMELSLVSLIRAIIVDYFHLEDLVYWSNWMGHCFRNVCFHFWFVAWKQGPQRSDWEKQMFFSQSVTWAPLSTVFLTQQSLLPFQILLEVYLNKVCSESRHVYTTAKIGLTSCADVLWVRHTFLLPQERLLKSMGTSVLLVNNLTPTVGT